MVNCCNVVGRVDVIFGVRRNGANETNSSKASGERNRGVSRIDVARASHTREGEGVCTGWRASDGTQSNNKNGDISVQKQRTTRNKEQEQEHRAEGEFGDVLLVVARFAMF